MLSQKRLPSPILSTKVDDMSENDNERPFAQNEVDPFKEIPEKDLDTDRIEEISERTEVQSSPEEEKPKVVDVVQKKKIKKIS